MKTIDLDRIDLNALPPEREPERQYYYMAKARKYIGQISEEAGRKLTFCVTTFGCQMNARDSEKLVGILEQIGYVEETDEEQADFVPVRRNLEFVHPPLYFSISSTAIGSSLTT